MKRPNWTREEHILALDLYIQADKLQLDDTEPRVIELSNFLRRLPQNVAIAEVDPVLRNPNGVSMKLGNFRSTDPKGNGGGLKNASKKKEKALWLEFQDDLLALRRVAIELRETLLQQGLKPEESLVDLDLVVSEGSQKLRKHLARERNPMIVALKKEAFLKQYGALFCEVCTFSFAKRYGQLGDGFMECHHIIPIGSRKAAQQTRLADLALLCSNCHRMVHRKRVPLSLDKVKELIEIHSAN